MRAGRTSRRSSSTTACASATAASSRSTACQLQVNEGEVRVPDRSVGLGQVDAAALHQRARDDRWRPRRCSTASPLPAPTSATSRKVRRRMGMVFQNFELFPHMTVLDNVSDRADHRAAAWRGAGARARAMALLDKVGLADKAASYPGGSLGRPAAARRDRPRARDGARGHAVRRADLGARSRDHRRGAERDEARSPTKA